MPPVQMLLKTKSCRVTVKLFIRRVVVSSKYLTIFNHDITILTIVMVVSPHSKKQDTWRVNCNKGKEVCVHGRESLNTFNGRSTAPLLAGLRYF